MQARLGDQLRRHPRLALASAVGAVVVVGVAVGLAIGAFGRPTADASPTPTASVNSSASQTSTPSHETPEASTTIEPLTGWRTVATFGAGGGWDTATTVVRSGETLLAVGFRMERGNKVGYNYVQGYQWTSTDGRSWTEVPLGTEFDEDLFFFQDVVAGPSGSFIAYMGVSYALDSGSTKNAIWQSTDGRTWQEADTDLDPGLQISKVVQGARGYLLMAQSLGTEPSLWLSANGLHWEEVHRFTDATHYVGLDDIGAGDEGFVAFGVRTALDNTWERFAFASADGREWVNAPQPFGAEDPQYRPPLVIAPLGPDWIAATAQRDDGAQIWFSANGPDWTPVAEIGDINTAQAWAPVLIGADRRLFFSPTGEFPSSIEVRSPGVWSSTDGREWTRLDLGSAGVIGGAASGPTGLVLVGATFPSADESKATFWLGPQD